jgi:vacuolar-type H+-ATPase subunit I/STV1
MTDSGKKYIYLRGGNMDSNRKAYLEKLKAKLDEWDAAIDRLSERGGQTVAQAKEEYQKQIAALKAQRQELEKKLRQLREASDSAWQDLKAGAESAWQTLGLAVKSAVQRLDEKQQSGEKKE